MDRYDKKSIGHAIIDITEEEDYSKGLNARIDIIEDYKYGPDSNAFDTIYFNNGDIILGKVTEIKRKKITYQTSDQIDGEPIVVKTKSISEIRYGDPIDHIQRKTIPSEITVSAISAILSFLFIPGLQAIIFGIIGLKKVKREPKKYKGKGWAWFSIILGSLVTALFILIAIVYEAF